MDRIGQGPTQNMASECCFSSHCPAEFSVVLGDADSANFPGNLLQYSTNVMMEKMFHNIYLEFSLFQCLFSSILHKSLPLPSVDSLIRQLKTVIISSFSIFFLKLSRPNSLSLSLYILYCTPNHFGGSLQHFSFISVYVLYCRAQIWFLKCRIEENNHSPQLLAVLLLAQPRRCWATSTVRAHW